LLRAVRRTGQSGSKENDEDVTPDDRSIGSNDDDIRITDGSTGVVTQSVARRTRESVMGSMPPPGQLAQQSGKHLDLLFALAYPQKVEKDASNSRSSSMARVKEDPDEDVGDSGPSTPLAAEKKEKDASAEIVESN
jgi:hypothetical protein